MVCSMPLDETLDSFRDASVTVDCPRFVSGVGNVNETLHRGGIAPSHVPSSLRRIPPMVLDGDTEAITERVARDEQIDARLTPRNFSDGFSRHPRRRNAHRACGNAVDAIALMTYTRVQPRRREGQKRDAERTTRLPALRQPCASCQPCAS